MKYTPENLKPLALCAGPEHEASVKGRVWLGGRCRSRGGQLHSRAGGAESRLMCVHCVVASCLQDDSDELVCNITIELQLATFVYMYID
jgi:hypothetical protein